MSSTAQAALRNLPVFDGLAETTLHRLSRAARVHRLEKGATVFLQGDRATAIRFVCDGWVKLYRISDCGTEAVIQLLPRARSLDEMAALRGANHDLSAQAVTGAQILAVDAGALRDAMAEDPCLTVAMMDMAARNIGTMFDEVERLKIRTGAQRLASFLLDHAPRSQGRVEFPLPCDKHTVASSLGLAPESLSRSFCRLRAVGVTLSRAVIRVADVEHLAAFAAEDQATVRARA
jgi:CRP/FNR family transcriptional regulator, dissimilatory nitrate respiration regulator